MPDKRPPKSGDLDTLFGSPSASEQAGPSHLAHWPPPFRRVEGPRKTVIYPRGEKPKRATARGWRLNRALFSEFSDD